MKGSSKLVVNNFGWFANEIYALRHQKNSNSNIGKEHQLNKIKQIKTKTATRTEKNVCNNF